MNKPKVRHGKRRPKLTYLLVVAVFIFVALILIDNFVVRNTWPPEGFTNGQLLRAELVEELPALYDPTMGHGTIRGEIALYDTTTLTLVTAEHQLSGMRVTVYAQDNAFVIDNLIPGIYNIWAKNQFSASAQYEINLERSSVKEIRLILDQENPHPYPASVYAAQLKFPSVEVKNDFRKNCNYCHSMGNPQTRLARSKDQWEDVINRMSGMGALLQKETEVVLPGILESGFDSVHTEPELKNYSPYLADQATIFEWPIINASETYVYVHDIAVGENGWIYGVDMNLDMVYCLNTLTLERKTWKLPDRGHPRGGYFRSAKRPVGIAEAHQGPHSVEYHKGWLWITAALGNEIIALDPDHGWSMHWSLPSRTFYPHTLRITENDIWFTIALSNHLGRLNLESNTIHTIPLPTSNWEQKVALRFMAESFGFAALDTASDAHLKFSINNLTGNGSKFLPLPYGIDIHPDGSIWYSKVYDDRIGKYDPTTGKIREWETPFHGPRRLRINKDGIVWIAGFVSGVLGRFDPETESFDTYPIPTRTPEWPEIPYALNIDTVTKHVWMTSTNNDALYRFDTKTRTFKIYPLPTSGTFMRELEFDGQNRVCTSYSNLPDYHVPEPEIKFMCLKTNQ